MWHLLISGFEDERSVEEKAAEQAEDEDDVDNVGNGVALASMSYGPPKKGKRPSNLHMTEVCMCI